MGTGGRAAVLEWRGWWKTRPVSAGIRSPFRSTLRTIPTDLFSAATTRDGPRGDVGWIRWQRSRPATEGTASNELPSGGDGGDQRARSDLVEYRKSLWAQTFPQLRERCENSSASTGFLLSLLFSTTPTPLPTDFPLASPAPFSPHSCPLFAPSNKIPALPACRPRCRTFLSSSAPPSSPRKAATSSSARLA